MHDLGQLFTVPVLVNVTLRALERSALDRVESLLVIVQLFYESCKGG